MLAPWKKSYDKPRDGIKKLRCYFADKGQYSQSYGFPSSHLWCEGWIIKKAECQFWCFPTVVLRILQSPLDCKENQIIIKEIYPEYSLEELMLKLKLQHFGSLFGSSDSLEKTLMLGKVEGRRRRGQQRMRWLEPPLSWLTWFEQTLRDVEGQLSLEYCSPWGCKELDMTEWLNNCLQHIPTPTSIASPFLPLPKPSQVLLGT